MHKAVCSECKKECEVPFKPRESSDILQGLLFKAQERRPLRDRISGNHFLEEKRPLAKPREGLFSRP